MSNEAVDAPVDGGEEMGAPAAAAFRKRRAAGLGGGACGSCP
jgi:hypothetical protein